MTTADIPPCQAACPIRTDVRGYVSAIARGDIGDAFRIIRQVNPLPSVCGRICTRPCESSCRRGQIDEAVAIRALKRFAAARSEQTGITQVPENSSPEKIAIIGSGPAGLTAAHDLALLGYGITIFEAQKVLGGLLSEGIPEYRLPKAMVKKDIDAILSLGIEARTEVSLGRDFFLEDLLREYQAVFLAIGSQKSLVPKCHGFTLPGIIPGVEFLKQVSRGAAPEIGAKVLIVGGGHTAMDAARTCIRLGSKDVTVLYRRTLEEMPAGRDEVEQAELEGVKVVYLTAPLEFLGEGSVSAVKCIKMKLGEPDATGRRRPVPIEGSEFEREADTVILAIGYVPDGDVMKHDGLSLNKNDTVIVQDRSGMTNIRGVFAAGDVVSGPLSVVDAMASGRKVADSIHRFLRVLPESTVEPLEAVQPLHARIAGLIPKEARQAMPVLPVEERIQNFSEIDEGYDTEQAVREAQRCLNCGAGATVLESCASCLNCVRVCPYGIPVPGKEQVGIDISQCQACGICASECPACAIDLHVEPREQARKAVEQVIEFAREETPEFLVIGFYCRYAAPVGPPAEGDALYWIGKFCTGRLETAQILYPFELGTDGVIIHTCRRGECRFQDGDRWTKRHAGHARKILHQTGIGSDRLHIVGGGEDIGSLLEKIRALGANPVREGKKVNI
ncbi:MAG: FAD-dependent oxidoreductase [Nitrospirota bacterium]